MDWVNLGQIHGLGSFAHEEAGASKNLCYARAFVWKRHKGHILASSHGWKNFGGLTNGEDDIRADLEDATAKV